jgi:hypothetical protein
MELSDPYTYGWLAWIAGFVVLEGKALLNEKRGDTLSEHVWHWFSIKHDGTHKVLRRSALGAGLGWLVLHFMGVI